MPDKKIVPANHQPPLPEDRLIVRRVHVGPAAGAGHDALVQVGSDGPVQLGRGRVPAGLGAPEDQGRGPQPGQSGPRIPVQVAHPERPQWPLAAGLAGVAVAPGRALVQVGGLGGQILADRVPPPGRDARAGRTARSSE